MAKIKINCVGYTLETESAAPDQALSNLGQIFEGWQVIITVTDRGLLWCYSGVWNVSRPEFKQFAEELERMF